MLAPNLLPPTFFLLTLSWVLTPGYSEQGAFNTLRQTPGEMLPRWCWTDGARETNSVNTVWAETIQSVVLASLYGAECCHAQTAAGRLASCAGLRSPLLHKAACFSCFWWQALKDRRALLLPMTAVDGGWSAEPSVLPKPCFVHQQHVSG